MGAVKTCTRCRTRKPLAAFSVRAESSDGLAHWCKPCKAEYDQERYAANVDVQERQQASSRAFSKAQADLRHAHPEEFQKYYRARRQEEK